VQDGFVHVLPVTHTPPSRPRDAVEIPHRTKRRLGLDSERSWIVVTETNKFRWPGPDLRFLPGGGPESVTYGQLPKALMRIIRERAIERLIGDLEIVERT
jgi:hypothetical protein